MLQPKVMIGAVHYLVPTIPHNLQQHGKVIALSVISGDPAAGNPTQMTALLSRVDHKNTVSGIWKFDNQTMPDKEVFLVHASQAGR